jgi:hypothetical protein
MTAYILIADFNNAFFSLVMDRTKISMLILWISSQSSILIRWRFFTWTLQVIELNQMVPCPYPRRSPQIYRITKRRVVDVIASRLRREPLNIYRTESESKPVRI